MEYRFLWAPILIFLIGYLYLRFAGKRAVANMSNFDLFVVAVIGTTLGGYLTDPDSAWKTIAATGVLVLTYFAFSKLMLNNAARNLLMAKPSVLIHKGEINEVGLKTARITVPELLGHLRLKGFEAVGDVEFAIMEEAGDISVIPKDNVRPVQVKDLHLQVPPSPHPVPVILDGDWIDENLQVVKRDRTYVKNQLHAHGLSDASIERLTLVTVDQFGRIWVDVSRPYHDDSTDVAGQYNSLGQASTGVLPPQHNSSTHEH